MNRTCSPHQIYSQGTNIAYGLRLPVSLTQSFDLSFHFPDVSVHIFELEEMDYENSGFQMYLFLLFFFKAFVAKKLSMTILPTSSLVFTGDLDSWVPTPYPDSDM